MKNLKLLLKSIQSHLFKPESSMIRQIVWLHSVENLEKKTIIYSPKHIIVDSMHLVKSNLALFCEILVKYFVYWTFNCMKS